MTSDYTIRRREYDDGRYGEFAEKDGQNHGPWRTYYANGKKHIERWFVNGREHGSTRTWNAAGQLIEEQNYWQGALHGYWREWDSNGDLTHERKFEYGDSIERLKKEPSGELPRLLRSLRAISPADAALRHQELVELLSRRSYTAEERSDPLEYDAPMSALGIITHLGEGESWPLCDNQPMVPLLQIRIDELPEIPTVLQNIALVSIFGAHEYPLREGTDGLKVRTYGSLSSLVAITPPSGCLRRKPCRIQWKQNEPEFPSQNDLAPGLRAYLQDDNQGSVILKHEPELATKVGGWPGWIQFTRLPDIGDFAFQIDSCGFPEWDAGDSTIFYGFRDREKDVWWSSADMC